MLSILYFRHNPLLSSLTELLIHTHAQGISRYDVIGIDPCIDEITCDILPPNQRFPVPGDCVSYYICSDQGRLSIEQCPNGQLFHYPNLVCSRRANPRCLEACEDDTDIDDDEEDDDTVPIVTPTTPGGVPGATNPRATVALGPARTVSFPATTPKPGMPDVH